MSILSSADPTSPANTLNTTDTTSSMRWSELVEVVRESGQYAGESEAERVIRVVLSALGGHVHGDVRDELALRLPEEAGRLIATQLPAPRHLTAAQFVDSVAARTLGATPATARWDVTSVLSVLPKAAGDDVIDDVLKQLSSGYALLFGKADLTPVT